MATFLSDDYFEELASTVNAHEGFTAAISNVDLTLQFEVPDAPDGAATKYFVAVGDGALQAGPGEADDPDATITNDYETAVAISKGDLNTQMAFMTGKLKVTGNMAKLMMNQSMLGKFAEATSGMDIEY